MSLVIGSSIFSRVCKSGIASIACTGVNIAEMARRGSSRGVRNPQDT